ncbi:uncharacterized protein LOC142612000 [Castanea sativa]|uniref:uncharacterized protein LOC142612000 n=1 Tax=Castanea sativa TaxID=21020 RepID=UPI003F65029F
MDRSQSFNAPPYFDGSNYAFWKVHMHAFLCAIDETVWDSIENGWVRLTTAKSEWDKAALGLENVNSKAINAIFCGFSIDEFYRISHVKTTKDAWTILETTYKGTKKVKDTKLQMLTTRFEEVKMSDDESFDSFYGRLNEIVIAKLNLGEKIEDAKVVRKVLRSLPKSFGVKVTAIEESKDLDEIKIQELVSSLQTYELRLPSYKSSKSLALKTINERTGDSSDKDDVEGVAYLAKNFRKFLKMKNKGKSFIKGRFSSSKMIKENSRRRMGKNHHQPKKFDLESSNSDAEGKCDSDGNYSAFMAITTIDSRDELSELVDDLGVHSEREKVDVSDDKHVYLNEGEKNLQEVYDALLEDCGKYTKVAKSAVKKMKKIEEEHKSTLVQLKDAKCEVEELKEELLNAYSKIKFLELKIIQADVKVERIFTKKLDSVLSSQKPSNDKTGLGYTGEGSSSSGPKKEMKFVLAKNVEKPKVEIPIVEKKVISPRPKEKGRSLPKNQRGPHVKHFCHHCGVQGHTRPNCFRHSRGLTLCMVKITQEEYQKEIKLKEKMKDNSLEKLWRC